TRGDVQQGAGVIAGAGGRGDAAVARPVQQRPCSGETLVTGAGTPFRLVSWHLPGFEGQCLACQECQECHETQCNESSLDRARTWWEGWGRVLTATNPGVCRQQRSPPGASARVSAGQNDLEVCPGSVFISAPVGRRPPSRGTRGRVPGCRSSRSAWRG